MRIGRVGLQQEWAIPLSRGLALALAGSVACAPEDTAMVDASASAGPGSASDGDSGDEDDEDDEDDGDDGDDGDEDDDDDGDGDGDDDDDSGDDGVPEGECDLTMAAAIQLSIDVSWPGGLAVVEGSGAIDAWLLADLTTIDGGVQLSGRMCELALPDFQTGALAGGETYGTEFPPAIWTNPSMPTIDALATVSSADPGAVLMLERGAVVLGGMMGDPLNDPWPSSWSGVQAVDHDGDGSPGLTAMAKTGAGYAYPRIDILNSDARAEALYIVSRTIMEFNGIVEDCDNASGGATVTMENHAVGCRMVGGGECSSGQTDTLDNNLPQFMVNGGHFQLARLPDGATCADAVAEFP
jgi:hypothetical protein